MTARTNEYGQPIGADLPDWAGAAPIPHTPMQGRYCDVRPLSAQHSADLFTAYLADETGALWTYMPIGPFRHTADFDDWMTWACASRDPLFFAIIDKQTGKPIGVASYLRIAPASGVAEVGYIAFAPALQKTPLATEAMYLMMRRIFDELGYRRYEWKCDALNGPSRQAAIRLGFVYEGTFRQALVYKGRNRDTAWFSIIDAEWPRIKAALENWLDPSNFADQGQQKHSLSHVMKR